MQFVRCNVFEVNMWGKDFRERNMDEIIMQFLNGCKSDVKSKLTGVNIEC